MDYLTITPHASVGYELAIISYNLLSNNREWNNCFIQNAPQNIEN